MSKHKKHMHSRNTGFTLIELSLSITFIGTLLVMATMTIVQSISVYNKGIAVKQMNQVGRFLTEDLRRISTDGSTVRFDDNGIAGYLCIDRPGANTRAYIWNSVKFGTGDDNGSRSPYNPTKKPYSFNGDVTLSQPITIARSNDTIDADGYCDLPDALGVVNPDEVTTLAGATVRMLSVDVAAQTGGIETLRKLTFWLGTYDTSVPGSAPDPSDIDGTWSCKGGSLGTFCAFSKYETVIYTPNPSEEP